MDEEEYNKFLSLKGSKTSREILLGSLGIETERRKSGPIGFKPSIPESPELDALHGAYKFGKAEDAETQRLRETIERQAEADRERTAKWFVDEALRGFEGDKRVLVVCRNCGERYYPDVEPGQESHCPRCGQINTTPRRESKTKIKTTTVNPPESAVYEEKMENVISEIPLGGETSESLEKKLNEAYLRLHGKFRYRKV